jgi:hypothetical protein
MKLECWHGTQSLVRFLLSHALMSTVSQSVICPHGICRRVLLVFPGSIITSKCAGLEHNRKGLMKVHLKVKGILNYNFLKSCSGCGSEGLKVHKQYLEHSTASLLAAAGWCKTCSGQRCWGYYQCWPGQTILTSFSHHCNHS